MATEDPLQRLLADGVIDEVLGRLKSGKEANISLVQHQSQVVAAKVYKDRAQRSFKNNVEYKEGRKVRNTRTQRAMDGGGRFGRDAAEEEWKSAEANALARLAGSGVRIPKAVLFYEGVLLMELVLDAEGRPAARLIDVPIGDAARATYVDLRAQMIAMLCRDLIHGDLSPYNILAGAAGPTIIDFPQVISAVHNSRAEFFFLRDFDNVLQFVTGFDPSLASHRSDGRAIWRAYVARDLTPEFVPPTPRPEHPRFDRRPNPRENVRPPEPARAPAKRPDYEADPPRPARPDYQADPPRPPPRPAEPARGGGQRPNPSVNQRQDQRGSRRDYRPDQRSQQSGAAPTPHGGPRREYRPDQRSQQSGAAPGQRPEPTPHGGTRARPPERTDAWPGDRAGAQRPTERTDRERVERTDPFPGSSSAPPARSADPRGPRPDQPRRFPDQRSGPPDQARPPGPPRSDRGFDPQRDQRRPDQRSGPRPDQRSAPPPAPRPDQRSAPRPDRVAEQAREQRFGPAAPARSAPRPAVVNESGGHRRRPKRRF
ncbi:MAG: hypothetical protein H0T79_19865 [Deltaproteobacteria bacterium]|nr:hypothetical protein [Deltaproteobacteria bacterium]